MLMKRTLIGAALFATGMGTAYAEPAYYDVAAPGGGSGSYTSVWDQLGIFANTTTTVFDTNGSGTINSGDTFSDNGNANVGSLIGATVPITDQGLQSSYELTVAWTGLTGSITSDITNVAGDFVNTIAYGSGTALNFYYDDNLSGVGATPQNYGPTVGSGDDTGFTDGTLVLSIEVQGGTGTNKWNDALGTNYVSGSSQILGEVTYAMNDFWYFDSDGSDSATAGDKEWDDLVGLMVPINFTIDQNTDNVDQEAGAANTNELIVIHSDHDGSIDFSVPEPGILLLMSAGLLGAGAVSRRKKAS